MRPLPFIGYDASSRFIAKGGIRLKLWKLASKTYSDLRWAKLWLDCFLKPKVRLEDQPELVDVEVER